MFLRKFQLHSSKKNKLKPHELHPSKMTKYKNKENPTNFMKLVMTNKMTSLWITEKIIMIITKNKILSMSILMNIKSQKILKSITI